VPTAVECPSRDRMPLSPWSYATFKGVEARSVGISSGRRGDAKTSANSSANSRQMSAKRVTHVTVKRPERELVGRLREHCANLEDFHQKACREGLSRYLGDVAGKLRVLVVYKSGNKKHRPLLLDLMDVTGIDVPITINKPGGQIQTDLRSYLARFQCAIKLPSGELAELTKSDLIVLWAEQCGAAHEDWELDERLTTIFAGGLFINGQPVYGYALCGICRTVLSVARRFLAEVDKGKDGAPNR
jgi:hypothetical protein